MCLLKLSIYAFLIYSFIFSTWYLFCPRIAYVYEISIFTNILLFSWMIANYTFDFVNVERVECKNKIILITGCGSGFGKELAIKLDGQGFHVFAGVRSIDELSAGELREKCSSRLTVIQMDVTKRDEVSNVIQQIKVTGLPLWAVVNNAGILETCPFDWGDDVEVFKRIFDTNVLGLVRVTKSCIPLIRESRGRIINISSAAGRISIPLLSHYCMSKHSVRAFSDCIRRELFNENIKVVTIEPAYYKTEMVNFDKINNKQQQIFENTPSEIQQNYNFQLDSLKNIIKTLKFWSRKNTGEVIQTIVNAITLKTPRPYYRCCGHEYSILLGSHVPEIILDPIINLAIMRKFSLKPTKNYFETTKVANTV